MKKLIPIALLFLLAGLSLPACSDDSDSSTPDDVSADDAGEDDTSDDTAGGDDVELPPLPDPDEPVALDFDEWLDAPGEGHVRAGYVTEAEMLYGDVIDGRVGDAFLENDHARYVINFGDRAIGACSWDGNPVDVAPLGTDGEQSAESVLGQICLLMNVGQTFRPKNLEIVKDGSDGQAIVAVTGEVAWLDFLNLRLMVDGMAPGLLNLVPINIDELLQLTVTVYYGLSPDSSSLRVVTAFRSHSEERIHFIATHMVLAGSTGHYFTPFNSTGGFGYNSLGVDNLSADPVSFISYVAERGHYTFVPDPHDYLEDRLPVGGGLVAISGAATITHGADDLMGALMAPRSRLDRTKGYIGLDRGEIAAVGYRLYTGDGSLESTAGTVYRELGVETGFISGFVRDHEGEPVAGATVTAIETVDGEPLRSMNQARTQDGGYFSLTLPNGSYLIRVRYDGVVTDWPFTVEHGGGVSDQDIDLPEHATVHVNITTPEGDPTPGRVTVTCVDDCGFRRPDHFEIDGLFQTPLGWLRGDFVGVDGEHTMLLMPGEYRVHVSRGISWSLWPRDTMESGGYLLTVEAGDEVTLDAEIAPVVDTSGALGGDFHSHMMASPDSPVRDELRILDYLSGGYDVIVVSNHETITDISPTIAELGASDHLYSIPGAEITTPNIGHINSFPLDHDPDRRRGGPYDWSNLGGYHLTLDQLIEQLIEVEYERVIQVNHPYEMGTFHIMQADVLNGRSHAPREYLRMEPQDPDPVTGDTGMWTDRFTAVEIQNGHDMHNFWSSMRWWMIMIGRGFSPAGTSTTDTHGLFGTTGGSPRTYVFVGEDHDTPATMDLPHYIRSINSGRIVGTNGPFMTVEIENADGEIATIGDTLDVQSGTATARVRVQVPEWMDVDTVDLYQNVSEDLFAEPGVPHGTELEPTERVALNWDAETDLVAVDDAEAHFRWEKTVEFELDTSEDAWVIFIVRGLEGENMRPVLSTTALPIAYSNPIYLDADGDGYDNPPYAHLVYTDINAMILPQAAPTYIRASDADHLTVDDIREIVRRINPHDAHHSIEH